MIKRITALLLSICLLFAAAPVYAGAVTGQRVYANAVTVTAGNSACVTLTAENFENIAALDVYVYYDPVVFTISGTYTGRMLSGAQASVNSSEAGTVKLSAMALDGISGTGELLSIYLETKSDCAPGAYPIAVAIGRAYDGNLSEATISGAGGSVTVKEQVITETFYLYGYRDKYYLKKDDVLTYTVRNEWVQPFVSGEFVVEYDHELFSFDSVTLWSELTGEGAVYSVNSSVLGQVRIAYANDDPVTVFELFSVKLRVIADADAYTNLKATAGNMYRADLTAYLPGSTSTDVRVEKLPEIVDHPDAFMKTERLVVGEQSRSVFCLEAGAGVAAADFAVVYDPAVLRCVSVTMAEGLDEKGGMVVINDNFSAGIIRFSYVNMQAPGEELPLVEILWEPLRSPDEHYQTRVSGVGVVDTDQKPISLEYVTDSGCIFIRNVVEPTCLLDGYTDHNCACGENFQTDPTEKLGHDIRQFPAQEATCTEIGWDAYEGCSRCDYGTYVEIPALGHDVVHHEAQVQTCLGIGWAAYETCNRCDYTTYGELPALGHSLTYHAGKQATCTEIGWNAYETCSRCDYTTYVETPALDHDLHLEMPQEPTCTQGGYEVSGYCSRCDYTVFVGIPELGHDLSYHEGKQATCTETGWYAYETCSRCDHSTYVEIPELGHELCYHAGKEATCTEIGWNAYETCSRCDYTTYVEIPALDHDLHLEGPQEPTCTQGGYEVSGYCSRCDYTVFVGIPELGHDLSYHEGKQATCTETGWYAYETCSRCDHSTYAEIPALMHKYDACFVWNSDHTACQAVFTCLHSCGTEETVDCAVSEDATDPARTVHTAIANYNGVQLTDRVDCQNYVITFNDWDNSLIHAYYCHWNRTVNVPADPIRAADNTYTYAFAGWDKEIVKCAGDTTYTATYIPTYIAYTVIFQFADGTPISLATYHYGDTVTVPQAPATTQPGLVFAGWDKIVTACTGDTVYTAVFAEPFMPGDLDGNEIVDEDDVIYLLQHLLMPEAFAVDQPVDYDKNGAVDEDDVIYLLQYLLMPDQFPL